MRLRFSEEHVRNVPDQPGIFCLWYGRDLVYVGCTAPRSGLRSELEHALAMAMADDMLATRFSFEPAGRPLRDEGRVLRAG